MARHLVHVAVYEGTETVYTCVSRDVDGTYYEIPEPLVVAYEQAREAWEKAQAAIVGHIAERHLREQDAY